MNKYACRYAIVQFMPYPETGEFANVGVIVAVPQKNLFAFQLEMKKCTRLTQFFQHLDRKVYVASVKALAQELEFLQKQVQNAQLSAQQAFDLMVRPLEAMLRFSKERVKMTPTPEVEAQVLFDRFVLHNFAQNKNYDAALQARVGRLVNSLNLKEKFTRRELGSDWYHVKMPLVQDKGDGLLRAIQPLHFDRSEPGKIIDHSNLWLGKLDTLRDLGKLPKDMLMPVEKPDLGQRDLEEAWLLAEKKLKNFADLTEASNEKTIKAFAKG